MDKETRLKRLYFRSSHRGSKETDLILGPYAHVHLKFMNEAALDEFEAFLDEGDNDIWDWVSGKSLPHDGRYHTLITELRRSYALSD
jgi:antitoxin CptB